MKPSRSWHQCSKLPSPWKRTSSNCWRVGGSLCCFTAGSVGLNFEPGKGTCKAGHAHTNVCGYIRQKPPAHVHVHLHHLHLHKHINLNVNIHKQIHMHTSINRDISNHPSIHPSVHPPICSKQRNMHIQYNMYVYTYACNMFASNKLTWSFWPFSNACN